MVNTEDFTRRLHQIMEYYELSAASFADRIDVGRSSISHLLSGRNKPSLDFVMKVISAFPEVELYWLLNGKGSFPSTDQKELAPTPRPAEKVPGKQPDLFSGEQQEEIKLSHRSKKEIAKIVILYTDGSFDSFEN